jgi:hypothetical protein
VRREKEPTQRTLPERMALLSDSQIIDLEASRSNSLSFGRLTQRFGRYTLDSIDVDQSLGRAAGVSAMFFLAFCLLKNLHAHWTLPYS